MATKLFLRNTTNSGVTDTGDGVVYDMVITAGAGSDTLVVNTQTGDNIEVQWTDTAGGPTVAFISGRVPAGGFTLTTANVSIWGHESNMSANCGPRVRVYRYQPGTPTITELGGPFDDDVEFGTSAAEATWTANVNDTAFSEDDRILIRFYIEDAPGVNMATGFTCTLTFNAADASTGDSFFEINETVTFKGETITSGPHAATAVGVATLTKQPQINLAATAIGVATITDAVIFAVSLAATAIGVGAASSLLMFNVAADAVAVGVGTLITQANRILAAVALGVGGIATQFIPGAGGGGGIARKVYLKYRSLIHGA